MRSSVLFIFLLTSATSWASYNPVLDMEFCGLTETNTQDKEIVRFHSISEDPSTDNEVWDVVMKIKGYQEGLDKKSFQNKYSPSIDSSQTESSIYECACIKATFYYPYKFGAVFDYEPKRKLFCGGAT